MCSKRGAMEPYLKACYSIWFVVTIQDHNATRFSSVVRSTFASLRTKVWYRKLVSRIWQQKPVPKSGTRLWYQALVPSLVEVSESWYQILVPDLVTKILVYTRFRCQNLLPDSGTNIRVPDSGTKILVPDFKARIWFQDSDTRFWQNILVVPESWYRIRYQNMAP